MSIWKKKKKKNGKYSALSVVIKTIKQINEGKNKDYKLSTISNKLINLAHVYVLRIRIVNFLQ